MDTSPELTAFLRERAGLRIGSGALILPDLLKGLRQHLGLEAAFISQFSGGRRIFRYVDQDTGLQSIKVGDGDPLEDSYCARVADGRLPELIQDAQSLPAAMELPVTAAARIGAHLSVPIRLSDGTIYGTFCCFGREPRPDLGEYHLSTMRLLADLTAGFVERELGYAREHATAKRRIESLLSADTWSTVFQPIKTIVGMRLAGYEALSRFPGDPARTPDVWFNDAAEVGLGHALELKAVEKALRSLELIPEDAYLSCNVSPVVATTPELIEVLRGFPLDRLVLEVTEHASVRDYAQLATALGPLRARGLRLAVDDAGAGYASFRHILSLQPDMVKLDVSLTRGIDADAGRRALAAAFVGFSVETGCKLIAEGVETAEELATLQGLGVHCVQGYFIGRPDALSPAGRS